MERTRFPVAGERATEPDRRAVSPVVGVLLAVTIVVVVAAAVGVASLSFADQLREPAPVVAESTGEFVAETGIDGQIVRITHIAGDPVQISAVEIVVDAECLSGDQQGRIVSLPPSGNSLDDENIAGDNFFDESSFRSDHTVLRSDTKNTLTAGEYIQFRITSGDCEVPAGNAVVVRVVHIPSGSIITQESITAS